MAKPSKQITLSDWIDRDLTAAARAGELPPAFEAEREVIQAEELLRGRSGRTPVFLGPPGCGKTAIVFELVRRAHAGEGVPFLRDAQVVQLSLRGISARFNNKGDATTFFGELCDWIVGMADPVVPFIRDVHLAYSLDWESALHRLLDRLGHPALCEGLPRPFDQMVEYWSDLEALMTPIPVEEPGVAKVQRIVDQWCAWRRAGGSRAVTEDARRYAVELTARFMGDKPFPRKAVDLLSTTLDLGASAPGPVRMAEVVDRFSQVTNVPERLIDPARPLDLAEVRSFVGERLLGQDEAVDSVVRMIALIKAGLADLRRPFGAFLFVGPTGVGKTHCAQLLAEYLFGARDRVVRLNMADYGEADDAWTLFGRPYAQSAKDQRGELAHRLRGHPFGVLLLDEFEKANRTVHDRFLQLLDEGRYINGRAETVSVASLIVIATSNAGAEVFRTGGLGFDVARDRREMDREIDRALARVFRFELLNRFDRVVHFQPLQRQHIRAIATRELVNLAEREGLRSRGLSIEVDHDVLDWLVAHGYHPHYGARFLRREIERSIAGSLAEFVVREVPPRDSRLGLGVRRDRVVVRMITRADDREEVQLVEGGPTLRLERGELVEEALAWMQRFEVVRASHRENMEQASKLIEASAGRGFWDDPDRAQDVLRRYKVLDARIQVERRLLRPAERLQNMMSRSDDTMNEPLGAVVSEAAVCYRRWLDLGAADAPHGVWLVLGPADGLVTRSEWLVDLVAMYRGWLRRQGFTYEVVAEEVINGEVSRLVLEVEGAGVLRVLEMEDGEHRRKNPVKGIDRARVWVIPRSEAGVDGPLPGGEVSDARRGRGVAVGRRTARLTVKIPRRGVEIVLHGNSRETLELLGRDLGGLFASAEGPGEVAREYGLRGGSVRDPRTSASVAQFKDVQRGGLEVFLRAWEAR